MAADPRTHERLLAWAAAASLISLPVTGLQALWVRRRIPDVPEAPGPRDGIVTAIGSSSTELLYLAVIGESTAAGVGAPDHERGLAGSTAAALADHTGRTIAWRVAGRSGATARSTRVELLPRLAGDPVDVVALALGVNDVLRMHSPRRWRDDLARLLEAIREQLDDPLIVVSSVPPVGKFPQLPQPLRAVLGLRARLLDRAAARLVASFDGAVYVSVEIDADDSLFCADRFHPSAKAYALWGERLAAMAAVLEETGPPARTGSPDLKPDSSGAAL